MTPRAVVSELSSDPIIQAIRAPQIPVHKPSSAAKGAVPPEAGGTSIPARALASSRRRLLSTAMDVEGGADAHHHGHAKARAMTVHPSLLLGCTKAYPQDVGCRGADHRNDFSIFLLCQQSERRRISAGDLDAVQLFKRVGQSASHTGYPSVKEVPVFRTCLLAECLQELRAVHSTL